MVRVNEIRLIGNIGKDAEVKAMESGKGIVSFSIATSEKYKNAAGDDVVHTDWHQCERWYNKLEIAEKVAAQLLKGKRMLIEGKQRNDSYKKEIEGKEYTFMAPKVLVEDHLFLTPKGEGENGNETTSTEG